MWKSGDSLRIYRTLFHTFHSVRVRPDSAVDNPAISPQVFPSSALDPSPYRAQTGLPNLLSYRILGQRLRLSPQPSFPYNTEANS